MITHNVLMVCDFFYPKLGGVEMHVWAVSQRLLALGHKVVVLTHAYPPTTAGSVRVGVRVMTHGLKVYYLPVRTFHENNTFPMVFSYFGVVRSIVRREGIGIVHGHQVTSTMMHECLLHARTLGCKTCYTDHSLFGFGDAGGINVNKLMQFTTQTSIDHAICVSHACRENLVLRAGLDDIAGTTSTIPNAVDASKFTPAASNTITVRSVSEKGIRGSNDSSGNSGVGCAGVDVVARDSFITVVIISRMTYRKGIDLVAGIIPVICARFPNVRFLIGGHGPKQLLLEEMRERWELQDRVHLLGTVPHECVRGVLAKGDVFLNSSLTESFCIALLEAAACGLLCVSTRVGGAPEVLPACMVDVSQPPRVAALANALAGAIESVSTNRQAGRGGYGSQWAMHDTLRRMYNWDDVVLRTVRVYNRVSALPARAVCANEYTDASTFCVCVFSSSSSSSSSSSFY